MLNQQLEQARISKETEIQLVRKQQAVLEEETKVAVERLRHNFELEMATQRTLQELALMKQKLDLYGKLSGTAELVSLQLANDPSQVDVVLQNNRNHELVTARLHLDAVRALIDADAVEGFQLQDVAKRSLERFLQLASGDMAANQPQRVDAEISAAPALAAPTPAEVIPEAKPASEADGSSAGS